MENGSGKTPVLHAAAACTCHDYDVGCRELHAALHLPVHEQAPLHMT